MCGGNPKSLSPRHTVIIGIEYLNNALKRLALLSTWYAHPILDGNEFHLWELRRWLCQSDGGETRRHQPCASWLLTTVSLSVSLTSPPYGLCLLIASQIEEVSITKAIFAIIPNVSLVILVSVLSLWIPEIMIALPKTIMSNFFDLK